MIDQPEQHTRIARFRFASFDGDGKAMPAPAPAKAAPKAAVPEQPAPVVIAPPAPPPITRQEVEAARAEGHARGRQEGEQAAEAKRNREQEEREEAQRRLMEVVSNRITLAAEAHKAQIAAMEHAALRLSAGIARKVAGEALKRDPYAAVESLLKQSLPLLLGEPVVTVHVAPKRLEGLRQTIDTIRTQLSGFEGKLQVLEDATLEDNDCRVEWRSGHAERRDETLWAEIEALLMRSTPPL